MARNTDPFDDLVAKWEPTMREAFLKAIQDISDRVNVRVVAELLERGDIDGAVRAVGLDPIDFRGLDKAIVDAFNAGGAAYEDNIPAVREPSGAVLEFRFDVRNPEAEQWTRDRAGNLITGNIVPDQLQMIRNHLVAGLYEGQNPRTTALDLVGRRSRITGLREGGIIGLTAAQEEWQRRYAVELTSTEPAELRKALERGLRDKRYDAAIRRAIASGKPISAESRAKMVQAYRNRSLKYRADVIARTETLTALSESERQTYSQAIGKGQVRADVITRFWKTAGDERVRYEHEQMPKINKAGVGFDEPFRTPDGGTVMNPPWGPQCRCKVIYRIDYFRGLT